MGFVSVSKNHLARQCPSLLLEEKVSPVRTLVTDVVENVAISPVVQPKENILLHTTSVTNRFRSADLCQLLLKEKPFPLNETFLTVSKTEANGFGLSLYI